MREVGFERCACAASRQLLPLPLGCSSPPHVESHVCRSAKGSLAVAASDELPGVLVVRVGAGERGFGFAGATAGSSVSQTRCSFHSG